MSKDDKILVERLIEESNWHDPTCNELLKEAAVRIEDMISAELISKQQAIDAIAKQSRFSAEEIIEICDKSIQDENGWLGGLKEAIQAVIELPSIQPENEFLDFLWNVINPNDMEKYLSMYHSKEEKRNG